MKKVKLLMFIAVCLIATSFASNSFGQFNPNGSSILYTQDNVGIGTSSPKGRLDVANGDLFLSSTKHGIMPGTLKFWGEVSGVERTYGKIWADGTPSTSNLYLSANGYTKHLTITHDNRVILSNPRDVISNNGGLIIGSTSNGVFFDNNEIQSTGDLHINNDNRVNLFINRGGGNVGIGTTNLASGYKLSVAGAIMAEKVTVKLQSKWPDFVFTNDYDLKSLSEVENFINKNSHLPGIPSAKEVQEEGVDLGEMNALLLQKIEELTLHMIEMKKEIEELQKVNQ